MSYKNIPSKMSDVLAEVGEEVVPSPGEQKLVNQISLEVVQIVNEQAVRVGTELIVGGSVAKNTWLPGIHDVDCFLKFNYLRYKDRGDCFSDVAEKILNRCFKNVKRLHGSRDYFQIRYRGFDVEIIPVLNISKPEMMLNITDVSPLHFSWLAKKMHANKLETDVRLAKKFCRGIGVYGAESFIRGLSGHVIEILTVHYGGFLKFIRAVSRWGDKVVIDPERQYHGEKQLMLLMNSSKLVSPLIVVDPIQPERNAAAVLSDEKFMIFRREARRFLANPSAGFFREKRVTVEQIKSRKTKNRLLLFSVSPDRGVTIDVAGCRILKQFEYIERLLENFDFKIVKKNWFWDKKTDGLLWFYVDPKKLSAVFRHFGPPVNVKVHDDAFRKQWDKYNVKVLNGSLYVDLPRKVRTADDFLRELNKDKTLNIKIIC